MSDPREQHNSYRAVRNGLNGLESIKREPRLMNADSRPLIRPVAPENGCLGFHVKFIYFVSLDGGEKREPNRRSQNPENNNGSGISEIREYLTCFSWFRMYRAIVSKITNDLHFWSIFVCCVIYFV